MKNIATATVKVFGRAGVLTLFALATASTSFAQGITKEFEFGPGTGQSRSHVRTFPIPCGTRGGVAATVKFRREGPSTAASDVLILIELRTPDTGPDQEGTIAKQESAVARPIEQTVTLRNPSSNRGCTSPWRVRVQHANDGAASFRVYGTIRLNWDGQRREIDVSDKGFNVERDGPETIKLGGSDGLGQGTVEITGRWHHIIGPGILPGPNPVKLKFELVDPSGTVLKTTEGYSSNEARAELPKIKLIYRVTKCTPGQWKLRITNIDDDDAHLENIVVNFTPDCPN